MTVPASHVDRTQSSAPAQPRQLAVLGSPISHSRSPQLHRAAYARLGWNAEYRAIDMTKERLPDFLSGLDASWRGLSLTMPLKRTILPYITDFEPHAAATQVVNTVVFEGGRTVGANTDVQGIVQALDGRSGHCALVLGSGATAVSATAALREIGVEDVNVASRKGTSIAKSFSALDLSALHALSDGMTHAHDADIIISTLPSHIADPLVQLLPEDVTGKVLLDVAYDPWPSALAIAWQDRGGEVVSGLNMLVEQALEQVRRFVPSRFPTTEAEVDNLRQAMYKAVV